MNNENTVNINEVEQQAAEELKKNTAKAEKILQDKDKLEAFLQKMEKKLKTIPVAGEYLSEVPVLASMIKSYVKKEYTEIPAGSICAIIGAILYLISAFDIIPDIIPGVGHIDDALVIAACLRLVESDVREYREWRDSKNNYAAPETVMHGLRGVDFVYKER